jgi:hypothetical protein
MFELTRRNVLKSLSCGFGYAAFAAMAHESAAKEATSISLNPLAPKQPHFPGTAKRVIFFCMRGGPSHVDTFDYRPGLKKYEGKEPGSTGVGINSQKGRKLMPSPWAFKKHGESGIEISDLYPYLSEHADDLCLINGAWTDIPNHPQALVKLHTGNFQFVRPSMGAWTLYGLGTENQDLPGFITMKPPARLGGAQNYGSAFLPAMFQGTALGMNGSVGIGNIKNDDISTPQQRKQIDLLQKMNKGLASRQPRNSEIDGIIESYELAFRMQSAVPQVMDISEETQKTQKQYGIGLGGRSDEFGRMCLMARRFAESGVRFIELTHEGWDQHGGLKARLETNCGQTDQPMAALISDLKERDMLKDTLLVWSGEFGRTPAVKKDDGRDHNATGFSMWMAGGGVKGGQRYGETDEFGIAAVKDKFHTHDFHATMLHLLGFDHKALTYRYAGRDFRLTDVFGSVADRIIT